MTEPDILDLRASIDAIDDRLFALFNERSELVKKVGAIKRQQQQAGTSFIRSGREADMVRRVYASFRDSPFPAAAAAQIWRMVISASLSLESPLAVSVFAPDPLHEFHWLAREYFGNFTPLTRQTSAKRVIGDIMDGKAAVGVVPFPDNSPEGLWWPRLPEDVKIFACVPFMLTRGAAVKILAIARVKPEPTGDDISFLSIETDKMVSQSRLKAVLDKYKLEFRWLAAESFPSGNRVHLIEFKGFHTANDRAFRELRGEIGTALLAINGLGAYAMPIVL